MEDILYDVIFYMCIKKLKLIRTFLRAQAYNITIEHVIQKFKGSSSLETSLMQRFKWSLQRTNILTTITDSQLIQRSVEYMTFLITTLPGISLGKTLSMDETEVFWKLLNADNWFWGQKHFIMKCTGFSLMRITECMGVW